MKRTPFPKMESLIAAASSFFFFSKRPLYDASDRYKLLHIARYILALSLYSIFFFLRILLSQFPPPSSYSAAVPAAVGLKNPKSQDAQICDSAVARSLSQMLSIMSSIRVGSRKYELVRVLAERVMDENVREGTAHINRAVLSSAFSRTMGRLEEALLASGVSVRSHEGSRELVKLADGQVSRALKAVRKLWVMAGPGAGEGSNEGNGDEGTFSAEKLAAELLWLAQKMAESGVAEEAVCRWGSASGLAAMAIGSQPRLQGALVKVSAFLFKQAKDMEELAVKKENYSAGEPTAAASAGGKKMNMLTSWLPLLCHASNGTDSPVLSSIEKAEMETVMEKIIEEGLSSFQQEQVLALWLHHFTACSSSDWPNLQACYARWYSASRRTLLEREKWTIAMGGQS